MVALGMLTPIDPIALRQNTEYEDQYHHWLVVWLFFPYIGTSSSPTDFYSIIFFRGVRLKPVKTS
jgi:hypothetical protein